MKACAACGSERCDDAWTCADCGNRPETIDGFTAFAPVLAHENAGFHADYFAELAALEAGNFWFRARNDLIAWAVRRYVPDARSYLEIGCGTGFVLGRIRATLPAADLSGSEIFTAGLAFAAERVPTASFYQLDARAIPFRDEFDLVGAFDVIEHIEDDLGVLRSVHGALRDRGSLLLTVPQHPALWSAQDERAFHVRRYTAGNLRARLEATGFEIVRMTSFVSLLLPLMFLSRKRTAGRDADGPADAMGDLRQPRIVNVALESVMAIERALIRGGVSFPAGGSLLVVARKRAAVAS